MMEIDRPIFIVGSGRSGTTIFFRTLAKHKELGYFNNYDLHFLRLFKLGVMPFLERNRFTRYIIEKVRPIKPAAESERVMEYCKISEKGIPLSESDAEDDMGQCLKKMIIKCLKYHKANRFLGKNTNDGMRIEFLNKIFPDSIFLHMLRDGRANVNSYLKVPFFHEIGFWWWNNKTLKDWINEGRTPEELGALHWKNNVREIIRQSRCLPKGRYLEIKYEEFTDNPKNCLKKVFEFCGLKWNKNFESFVETAQIKNMNFKWKKNLSLNERKVIESILHSLLKKLDYI